MMKKCYFAFDAARDGQTAAEAMFHSTYTYTPEIQGRVLGAILGAAYCQDQEKLTETVRQALAYLPEIYKVEVGKIKKGLLDFLSLQYSQVINLEKLMEDLGNVK